MLLSATAQPVDGTLRHEVDVNGRHRIVTDEPERLGGTDTGPAPHELLPAMLAACISTVVSMYVRARGWDLPGLSVQVTYDPEQTPRPIEVVLHLPQGLSPGQLARLRRVAETCPVRRAFEAGFTIDEHVLLDGSSDATAEPALLASSAADRPG